METVHITIHSEAAVDRIAGWCIGEQIEFYIAPKPESSERNPAERVVVVASQEKISELTKYITANGLRVEYEVYGDE